MVFQNLFLPFVAVSITLTIVAHRGCGTWIPYWSIPLIAVIILLLLYVTAVVYTALLHPFFSPLRHLPKAPQPSLRHRLFKEPSAHHFEKWMQEVPNDGLIRYHGVLNLERVLVTSPKFTRQILQTHASSYEKQYGQRTHLERVGGRGLVWHEGKIHRYLRKVLEPAFRSGQVRDSYFPPVARKTEEMLRILRGTVNATSIQPMSVGKNSAPVSAVIELDEIIHRTVFDIIGLLAFGPDLDFQSIFRPELYYDPLKDYRDAFKPSPSNRTRVYAAFFLPTWVVNIIPIRFNVTTGLAIRRFRRIGTDYLRRQKAHLLQKGDFPQNQTPYIMQPIFEGGKLSDQDLLEQFSMFQAGGIHSTGAAIMSTLWWLAHPNNLNIQRHLRSEIWFNIPSGDPQTWSSPAVFESCHYLNAVIHEVLRLHPPFSWLGRTPNEWVDVGGTALPPGLSISLSAWAYHRDPTIWSHDAAKFRPERWLSASGLFTTTMLPNLLSFGAGPRKCIADNLAKMELRCVVAALFGRFEFRAASGIDLPGVTHQSTLAFRDVLRLETTSVEGWGE